MAVAFMGTGEGDVVMSDLYLPSVLHHLAVYVLKFTGAADSQFSLLLLGSRYCQTDSILLVVVEAQVGVAFTSQLSEPLMSVLN